jgi:hypothetical protein
LYQKYTYAQGNINNRLKLDYCHLKREFTAPLRMNKIHPIKEGNKTSEVLIIINRVCFTFLMMSVLDMYVG